MVVAVVLAFVAAEIATRLPVVVVAAAAVAGSARRFLCFFHR